MSRGTNVGPSGAAQKELIERTIRIGQLSRKRRLVVCAVVAVLDRKQTTIPSDLVPVGAAGNVVSDRSISRVQHVVVADRSVMRCQDICAVIGVDVPLDDHIIASGVIGTTIGAGCRSGSKGNP